jgi:hypothetical protein
MKRIGLFAFMLCFAALAISDSANACHHRRGRRGGCGGCGGGYSTGYDAGYGSPIQKGGFSSPVQNGGYGNPSPDGGAPAPPAPPSPPAPGA